MPQINQAGLSLIESFEGDKLQAYRDTGGVETIGYGHTGGVAPGETITEAQAVAYLKGDVAAAAEVVQGCTAINLTPNQFAALTSFEYNTGALAGSPGMALINQEQFSPAWDAHLCLWVHDAAGNVQPGLVRRRAAEKALFFTP